MSAADLLEKGLGNAMMETGVSSEIWDKYILGSNEERRRVAVGRNLISRDDCPMELTPLGHLRWYLSPELAEPTVKALYRFELEIPPGSRSGRWFHQGGIVHYVLEGEGHTIIESVSHEWSAGDVIAIPVRLDGIEFQHINTCGSKVRLLVTFANLDSALGSAGGVDMRITEACPEYSGAATATRG